MKGLAPGPAELQPAGCFLVSVINKKLLNFAKNKITAGNNITSQLIFCR
jgi:hypothetical protein